MGGPSSVNLPNSVAPGATVNVTLSGAAVPQQFKTPRNVVVGSSLYYPGMLRVYIDHTKAFTHLDQLLRLFYPEILVSDDSPVLETRDIPACTRSPVMTPDLRTGAH